jgi:hypothetical protein
MTAVDKLKALNISHATALLIEQHLKTYSTNSELWVVEMGSTVKLSYKSSVKSPVNQVATAEGVMVFIGGEPGAEGTVIIFNASAMKVEAEAKFEKEEAAEPSSRRSKHTAAQPKAAAKPAASAEDNKLAMTIGKGVLYTAGAVAAGAAGLWAWKKWGQ